MAKEKNINVSNVLSVSDNFDEPQYQTIRPIKTGYINEAFDTTQINKANVNVTGDCLPQKYDNSFPQKHKVSSIGDSLPNEYDEQILKIIRSSEKTMPSDNMYDDYFNDIISDIFPTNNCENIVKNVDSILDHLDADDADEAYDIAKNLCHKHRILAVCDRDTLFIYYDDFGSFIPYTRQNFAKFLFQAVKDSKKRRKLTSHFSKEVFHFLVNDPDLQTSFDEFNNAEEWLLNLKNGVLDVRTLKLLPHAAEYRFTYTLQVNFPQYPKIPKKFFSVLEKCFDDESDRKLCMESMAYTLSSNSSAKAIWFYVGMANTGKSMLLRLLTRIIGDQYISSIPLERLEGRFDLKTALHCRANIVAEVNNMRIKEVKTLKAITGGDSVPIEGKYETAFYATLSLKFLLAGNHLPTLDSGVEKDDGVLKRFHFLSFDNPVNPADRIGNFDKILYYEEADDIFYELMKRLQKFYKRGCRFKSSKRSIELSDLFCGVEKSLEQLFFEQCCVQSPNGVVSVVALENKYTEFCKIMGRTPNSRKRLTQYILSLSFKPIKDRARLRGDKNPVSIIRGIDFSRNIQE